MESTTESEPTGDLLRAVSALIEEGQARTETWLDQIAANFGEWLDTMATQFDEQIDQVGDRLIRIEGRRDSADELLERMEDLMIEMKRQLEGHKNSTDHGFTRADMILNRRFTRLDGHIGLLRDQIRRGEVTRSVWEGPPESTVDPQSSDSLVESKAHGDE